MERDRDSGSNERGVGEYYAVVTIVPGLRGDMRVSNEVKLDLEPLA